MEADVVVNFLNFFIDAEEEDLSSILEELQKAGIECSTIDEMFERILDNEVSGEERDERSKK